MSDDLLTPSLDRREARSILSVGPFIAAAFFGGPIAVTILAVMNSMTLQRLGKDWAILALGLLLGIAGFALAVVYLFDGFGDSASIRLGIRAGGFLTVLVVYLLHKHELRAVVAMGKPRSPWLPAIAAIAVAVTVNVVLAVLIRGV